MRRLLILPVLFLTFMVGNPVVAAEGIVVLNKSGCKSRYIVETTRGYVILEWFGGNDPSEGNRIVGDFETYGMKKIINTSVSQEGQVWVEDFWLSKSSVVKKMRKFCN
jgi:hypothetical protein